MPPRETFGMHPPIHYGTSQSPTTEEASFSSSESKISLAVIMLVVLVGDMARGILFPTLWPYVSMLGGSKAVLGFLVASFSFGRVISSPALGRWSGSVGYRKTLVGAQLTIALGTAMYASSTSLWMLALAQVIMGLGSGTLGVTRAYVAEKSSHEQKTYMLAYLTAMQYAGFTCTPMLGTLLCKMAGPATSDAFIMGGWIRWDINMFTAPALFMTAMSLLTCMLLFIFFVDDMRYVKPRGGIDTPVPTPIVSVSKSLHKSAKSAGEAGRLLLARDSDVDQDVQDNVVSRVEHNDESQSSRSFWLAICGGFLLNIATKGTIACYETLGAEYAIRHLGLSSAQAGFGFSSCGVMGVAALLSLRWLTMCFNDVQIVLGGMVVMIASASLVAISDPLQHAGTIWFFAAVFLMYSIGYPIGHTAVLGMFSKVVGKRPQGELLGWFGSAGSMARIIFPISAGIVAQLVGSGTVFLILSIFLLTSFFVLLACRHTFLKFCT